MKETDFYFAFEDATVRGDEMSREQLFKIIEHLSHELAFVKGLVQTNNTSHIGPVH